MKFFEIALLSKKITIAFIFPCFALAQQPLLTLQELISIALENNLRLKKSQLEVAQSKTLVNSAFNFDKTQLYYSYDENNLASNNLPLRILGFQQDFSFPTVYFSEKKVNIARYDLVLSAHDMQKKEIERQVTETYFRYQIVQKKQRHYRVLDSLFHDYYKTVSRQYELGETNYLEKITAASKQRQINLQYRESQKEVSIARDALQLITQIEPPLSIAEEPQLKVPIKAVVLDESPQMQFYKKNLSLAQALWRNEKQKLLPDISLNYFQGTNTELKDKLYGYQLGLTIPLLFGGQQSQIKASQKAREIAAAELSDYEIQLKAKLKLLNLELHQIQQTLDYFENEGKMLSEEIIKTAEVSFQNGEIDFGQYFESLESAYRIKLSYLDKLNEYNSLSIPINYLAL